MKIILSQDVINLGEEGDICDVTPGFARNCLIPQKMAISYSKENLRILESKKTAIEGRKEEKRKAALSMKERMESENLVFRMSAGETGKLFGSVGSAIIIEELEKLGYQSIERKRVEVPENHLRTTGEHTVIVKLYGQEEAKLKITIESLEA